jgi:hypothetical protein
VFAQKPSAPMQSSQPMVVAGTKSRPAGLNHRIHVLLLKVDQLLARCAAGWS